MIYVIQLYLILVTSFLAAKDATSYLLKTKEKNPLVTLRVKRWHRDGVILNCLVISPLIQLYNPIEIFLVAVIIRLMFFDVMFNKFANLPIIFLGTSATSDTFFSKIFGKNGAFKKAVAFGILLLLFNLYNIFIK